MANEEHLKILRQGVTAWNQWRLQNPDIQPDLSDADLREEDISWRDLRRVILSGADLRGADGKFSKLSSAYLDGVDLRGACLKGTVLRGVDLRGAYLSGADLSKADVGYSILGDIDLSAVEGLDTIKHIGPSTIGIDTIYRSNGKIPEVFLRGAGVPEAFIIQIPSLVEQVTQFYSCFISYSSKDQTFVERLHNDLQGEGVRCWFAPEDIRIGDRIRPTIDQAIRLYDKLLLVLSEHSIDSDWVEKEVETAFEEERKRKRIILFPIRLDSAVRDTDQAWAADIRRTRHIGDFTKWKDDDAYQKAFDRLLRDLKAEEVAEAEA